VTTALPLFPLGSVLFPGLVLPITVGRPLSVAAAQQAVREQRRIAGRSRRNPNGARGTGFGELTRSERRIAALVTEGLTNRQVAQLLYVTEKTVEMHLSNVFAKLGVSSRAAVAGLVARAGAE
jgi:DNA-binding NarL/FixJ family response regulator